MQTRERFVADRIERDIVTGILAPGSALRQDALARDLGVSHIPVREALGHLSERGLVEIVPHRGARVATFTAAEFAQTLETRVLLECAVLRLSAPRLVPRDFDDAELAIERFAREPARDRWPDSNWAFHEAIYRGCVNAVLLQLVRRLHEDPRSQIITRAISSSVAASNREHRELLAHLRAGRIDDAVALLGSHIGASDATIARALRTLPEPSVKG
jgi:DNA-binding GntR family transcriptional regulator